MKESVEKDAFIASGKKKVQKQSVEASASDPVLHELERVCRLAEKMGEVVGLLDYVPDRYTSFRQIDLCEREIRFPVKQVVVDRNGRIATH